MGAAHGTENRNRRFRGNAADVAPDVLVQHKVADYQNAMALKARLNQIKNTMKIADHKEIPCILTGTSPTQAKIGLNGAPGTRQRQQARMRKLATERDELHPALPRVLSSSDISSSARCILPDRNPSNRCGGK